MRFIPLRWYRSTLLAHGLQLLLAKQQTGQKERHFPIIFVQHVTMCGRGLCGRGLGYLNRVFSRPTCTCTQAYTHFWRSLMMISLY